MSLFGKPKIGQFNDKIFVVLCQQKKVLGLEVWYEIMIIIYWKIKIKYSFDLPRCAIPIEWRCLTAITICFIILATSFKIKLLFQKLNQLMRKIITKFGVRSFSSSNFVEQLAAFHPKI